MNEELGNPMTPWFADDPPPDPPQSDEDDTKGGRNEPVKQPQKG